MQACIVVPCFNEEKRICTKSFLEFANSHEHISFIFVNDGSTDKTVELLESLKAQSSQCHYMSLSHNQGKASAVREGMLKAFAEGFTHIGYLDADLTIPLTTAKDILETLRFRNVDMAFASRTKRLATNSNQSLRRKVMGSTFSFFSRAALRMPIRDTQCGAKFFTAHTIPVLFEKHFMSKWIFDVEIFFRFKAHFKKQATKRFFEYPLEYWEDNEQSKIKMTDYIKGPFSLASIFFYYL